MDFINLYNKKEIAAIAAKSLKKFYPLWVLVRWMERPLSAHLIYIDQFHPNMNVIFHYCSPEGHKSAGRRHFHNSASQNSNEHSTHSREMDGSDKLSF